MRGQINGCAAELPHSLLADKGRLRLTVPEGEGAMRAIACLTAVAFLTCAPGRAEDLRVKDVTISVEPMTFYSGDRNRFPHWGRRMDCATSRDRPAGARDRWIGDLCGAAANQKPVVKQIGSNPGGPCGYARYAVACVRVQ
jgi:hypothetical protein